MSGNEQFTQGDRSYIGHNYLPNEFKQVAKYSNKMFCGTYSKDGNIFLSASQGLVDILPSKCPLLSEWVLFSYRSCLASV